MRNKRKEHTTIDGYKKMAHEQKLPTTKQ